MKSLTLFSNLIRLALLALLLPAGWLVAQNPDSPAVSQLLASVKNHATLADDDASTLESYTRSNLRWSTHGAQLNKMKDHVNNLIRDANRLSSMRNEASPWQQEAIDRVSALLPEMASYLTETINHFNDKMTRITLQPYREMVLANQKIIHDAREIIADIVDYDKAKARADALEKQLQLPAAASPSS